MTLIRVVGRFQGEGLKYGRKGGRVKADFLELEPFVSKLDLDLADVASSLFLCEELKNKKKLSLDDRIRFSVDRFDVWNSQMIRKLIQDILSFMVKERPIIQFTHARPDPRMRIGNIEPPESVDSVTLFSGGVDSVSGILNIKTDLGSTSGVFVNHSNISTVVQNLVNGFLSDYNIDIFKVNIQRSSAAGIQQLRGFVYLSFGSIIARILQTNKIFISESGPIMYQPHFAPTDLVTLTTHPTLITLSKRLFKELYGIEFRFYEPFENLTKAEIISLIPEQDIIPLTTSCISTRFVYSSYSHCGTCYGCLVRRLSCLVAGVRDAEYCRDVLLQDFGESGGRRGTRVGSSSFSDMLILLRFARDVIEAKLPEHTAQKIREYGKEKLFRRYAMDIISGIYILYEQQNIGRGRYARDFFDELKRDGVVSVDELDNRIAEVRERRFSPNYNFFL